MCTRRIFGLACLALLMTLRDRVGAYTNQWAAHIEGGPEVAKKVAEDHGFRYLAERGEKIIKSHEKGVKKLI
ncbi:hypothetical protein V1478_017428 [Vespula squamosa]|uniref:Peptidase S8 pro-domain domain-containing protein n=1 Tax=Vespula squamosa TaxID=30214 RepID=A0ABD1ZXG2_VESSQ